MVPATLALIPSFEDWEEWFRASERRFRRALEERDTVRVLRLVFDRLYDLRNQIVHGGATWNSRVNRDQVRGGAALLAFLMPVFVDVMMDNPHENWGAPSTRYGSVRHPTTGNRQAKSERHTCVARRARCRWRFSINAKVHSSGATSATSRVSA